MSKQQKIKLFRNIPNTRSANVPYTMSASELKEYATCHSDVFYFLERILGLRILQFHRDMVNNYLTNRFVVNLCSREIGQKTIMTGVFLWESTFWPDRATLVVGKYTDVWFEQFFELYKKVPYYMQLGIKRMKSGSKIDFDNRSRVHCRPYSKGSFVIGQNYSSIFLTQFAYLSNDQQRKMLQNVFPIVSAIKNTKLTLESQPNGMNLLYDIVVDSERFDGDPLKNCYKVFRAYWWQTPEKDSAWKQRRIELIGESAFNAEYDLSFKTPNI